MSNFLADRVSESSVSTGIDPYILLGAFNSNCQSAESAGVLDGQTFEYSAHDPVNGGFETGLGTWITGGILIRTIIYASSNSGLPVVWSIGTRQVSLTLTAIGIANLEIPALTYSLRGVLRTLVGRNAQVEGLGIFNFVPNSLSVDDDETTFSTPIGAWHLSAISPDYLATQSLIGN